MTYKNIERGGVEYTVPMPGTVVEDIYGSNKYLVVEHVFDQTPDDAKPAKGRRPSVLVVREIVDDLYLGETVKLPGDEVAVRPGVMKAHKAVRYYALPFYEWHGPVDSSVTQDNMLVQAITELRRENRELHDMLDTLRRDFDSLKSDIESHERKRADDAHGVE